MTPAGHDTRHGGLHGARASARASPWTSAPTSGPSASCCARCSPGKRALRGRDRHRRARGRAEAGGRLDVAARRDAGRDPRPAAALRRARPEALLCATSARRGSSSRRCWPASWRPKTRPGRLRPRGRPGEPPGARGGGGWPMAALSTILAVASGAPWARSSRRDSESRPSAAEQRRFCFRRARGSTSWVAVMALSRDGRTLGVVARGETGVQRLFVRRSTQPRRSWCRQRHGGGAVSSRPTDAGRPSPSAPRSPEGSPGAAQVLARDGADSDDPPDRGLLRRRVAGRRLDPVRRGVPGGLSTVAASGGAPRLLLGNQPSGGRLTRR